MVVVPTVWRNINILREMQRPPENISVPILIPSELSVNGFLLEQALNGSFELIMNGY